MIYRVLRRIPVRPRIAGAFLILVVLLALSLPLIVANQNFLVQRLQQISDVEARADRLLLLSLAPIESSRANLMRYIQRYAPSADEALDDVDQAAGLLNEARGLITLPEQGAAVESILAALADYEGLVEDIEAARSEGDVQTVSAIQFETYRLGKELGQRIEQIVGDSEARVAAANELVYAEALNRMLLLGAIYVVAVVLALVMAALIQRSITRPIAELRTGAEAFQQGQLQVTIPVVGSDELSLLAQTFNEFAAQLSESVSTLEERVAERTLDLARRTVQMETSARVAREAASIRDVDQLLDAVVQLISQRFDFYHAGIFLLDEAKQFAVLRAASSEGGKRMLARDHRLRVGEEGVVGFAAGRGEPRVALDVGGDAQYFDNPDLPRTRSEVALPLLVGGQVIGVLDVQSLKESDFDEQDVSIMQTLADQVSLALENARLLDESELRLGELQALLGQQSTEGWRRLVEARPDWSFVYDGAQVLSGEVSEADGLLSPGADSDMRVPLRVRDEVVGHLNLSLGGRTLASEELQMVQAVTDQIGLALESARLYQGTQLRVARERLLGQVATRVRETLDIRTVLDTAAQEIGESLGLAAVEVRLGTGPGSPEPAQEPEPVENQG